MRVRVWLLLLLLAGLVGCGSEQQVDAPSAPTTVPLSQIPRGAEPPTAAAAAPSPAAAAPATASAPPSQAATQVVPPPAPVSLPPGFGISVFADDLKGPRMLTFGPDGSLYVAERGAGRIVRLPDANNDGVSDGPQVVAEGLEAPSSLDFGPDGSLYVGETTRVVRLSNPDAQGVFQQRTTVVPDLPAGGNHTTRTVLVSPDGATLYVSIGSTCNVCVEEDERRATIMQYDLASGAGQIYAAGLRNAVGIDFRPGTEELWATNNGRDFLGDDQPPETVNRITAAGLDFGWPRCHAGRIVDPEFGSPDACAGVTAPVVEMQAHSAPLGLAFSQGQPTGFPAPYDSGLFVAFHGSWNRSQPTGYKVVFIPLNAAEPGVVQDFATGWRLDDGTVWGRPVGLAFGPAGSLYVSDDTGGMIYRIFAK